MVVDHAERLTPERTAESLRRVLNAGRHLLRLINEILDLSKIEAGKMELSIETVKFRWSWRRSSTSRAAVLQWARPGI
jgi:signal transduction histidine kinase